VGSLPAGGTRWVCASHVDGWPCISGLGRYLFVSRRRRHLPDVRAPPQDFLGVGVRSKLPRDHTVPSMLGFAAEEGLSTARRAGQAPTGNRRFPCNLLAPTAGPGFPSIRAGRADRSRAGNQAASYSTGHRGRGPAARSRKTRRNAVRRRLRVPLCGQGHVQRSRGLGLPLRRPGSRPPAISSAPLALSPIFNQPPLHTDLLHYTSCSSSLRSVPGARRCAGRGPFFRPGGSERTGGLGPSSSAATSKSPHWDGRLLTLLLPLLSVSDKGEGREKMFFCLPLLFTFSLGDTGMRAVAPRLPDRSGRFGGCAADAWPRLYRNASWFRTRVEEPF